MRVTCWRLFRVFDCHDLAGFGLVIEMQLDATSFKLPQHILNAPLDGRMVRAITGDKFLDYGSQRRRRKFSVWDTHRSTLPHNLGDAITFVAPGPGTIPAA